MRSAPRSAPRVQNYNSAPRTNINVITPGVGYGGYRGGYGGYGYGGYGYGGFGYGPFGLSTGSVGLDVGIGVTEMLIREQQRQAFLQNQIQVQRELGRDAATIDQLQREVEAGNARLAELEQKISAEKAQAPSQAAPAP
jgi:hypothetical protein